MPRVQRASHFPLLRVGRALAFAALPHTLPHSTRPHLSELQRIVKQKEQSASQDHDEHYESDKL
jgi:hypothetical protein